MATQSLIAALDEARTLLAQGEVRAPGRAMTARLMSFARQKPERLAVLYEVAGIPPHKSLADLWVPHGNAVSARLRKLVETGGQWNVADIAAKLEVKIGSVSTAISRLRRRHYPLVATRREGTRYYEYKTVNGHEA